jgi:hypothetical protein
VATTKREKRTMARPKHKPKGLHKTDQLMYMLQNKAKQLGIEI